MLQPRLQIQPRIQGDLPLPINTSTCFVVVFLLFGYRPSDVLLLCILTLNYNPMVIDLLTMLYFYFYRPSDNAIFLVLQTF